ncbi:MAG TPA: UrcA family protein [Steroidobacteraceae bacterium]|nr:UrcA family protein [Steroidobacteraceae bacterium]
MDTSIGTPRTGRVTRLATLALAAGAVSFLGSAAFAQNSSTGALQPTVTVKAPRVVQHRSMGSSGMSVVQFSQTRVVSFSDLNLDTPEGKIALHQRIRANARAACEELASTHPFLLWTDDVQTCVQQAMLTWMPRAHAFPLDAR